MYQVVFNADVFAELENDVQAFQLAIALHQSSNQDHVVEIMFDGKSVGNLQLKK